MRVQLHLVFEAGTSNPQSFETIFDTECLGSHWIYFRV